MKAFDVPDAHMIDVDLLIEDKLDMIRTISILEKENYEVKKLKLFYPYKLTATRPSEPIIIDLYHKPKWYDFTYAPEGLVSSSRIRGTIHGVDTFLPSAELNVYLVATHGYSHGRVTLEEILHITNVVQKHKPDLSSLIPIISKFRTAHALYCYIWLTREILKQFGHEDIELEQFLTKLQRDSLTRYFRRWIEPFSSFQYRNFPIYIPFKMLAFSGLTKLSHSSLDPSVKRYDEVLIALRHFFFSAFLFGQFGQILLTKFR